jgi:hypothetical protein
MTGTVTSYDATTQSLVCNMTTASGTGTFTSWRVGYRGPRFDHTSAGVCRGLLIEESRTNSITGSNAFNTWTLGNSTVASSSVVTPEGTADAWKLVEDSLLANHNATRSFTPVSGTTYTASVWLKSAENSFGFVGLTGGGFPATFISVNLSTGAVSTAVGTPVGATSVAYSNGWWRVSFSLAATASLSSVIDIRLSRDGNWANRSYLGNGVNGMYCYGGQVEAGSFPTSYIPTTTGTLARSADVCSITGGDFNNFYNQSEGTVVAVASEFRRGTAYVSIVRFAISSDASGNRFQIGTNGNKTGDSSPIEFIGIKAGVIQYQSFATSPTPESRAALAYKTDDIRGALNGTLSAADSPPSEILAGANSMSIGTLGIHIASIRYYRKRLPNAKLQALTV